MKEEYEYSIKVKSVSDFIDYCENNDYKLSENYEQQRTLFKKENGYVMGRITKNIYDFKDDNQDDKVLKICRESKNLIIDDDNREFVISLLEILNLTNKKILHRIRRSYIKDNVVFEIDEYINPKMNVVAIEGVKSEVDKVYNDILSIIERKEGMTEGPNGAIGVINNYLKTKKKGNNND